MSKIKNHFWEEINMPNHGDQEPDLEDIMNACQPTLDETLAFAKEYMKTPQFAKEWAKFKQQGSF